MSEIPSSAKRSTRRRTARKSARKRTPAKRSAAKRTTAKRAVKRTAKRAAARRPSAKRGATGPLSVITRRVEALVRENAQLRARVRELEAAWNNMERTLSGRVKTAKRVARKAGTGATRGVEKAISGATKSRTVRRAGKRAASRVRKAIVSATK
jgi:DNA-binding protein HU-beta